MTTPGTKTSGLFWDWIATATYALFATIVGLLVDDDNLAAIIVALVFLLIGAVFLASHWVSKLHVSSISYGPVLIGLLLFSLGANVFFFAGLLPAFGETSLETLQPKVRSYGGNYDDDDTTHGASDFWIEYGEQSKPTYHMTYDLYETSQDAWAGMYFEFPTTQDLSKYSKLQLRIRFGENGKDAEADCDLILERNEPGGTREELARIDLRKANGHLEDEIKVVNIDLARDFSPEVLEKVDILAFGADSGSGTGRHTVVLNSITFVN